MFCAQASRARYLRRVRTTEKDDGTHQPQPACAGRYLINQASTANSSGEIVCTETSRKTYRVDAAQTPGAARNGKRLQAAKNLGRIIEINPVDDARLERSPIHLAPGLNHEGLILMFGKPLTMDRKSVRPPGPSNVSTLDAAVLKRRRRSSAAADVVTTATSPASRPNHLRFKRNSKLGIDDDAQKRPAAGFAASIREQAIVRKQRPDACENRIGCVAQGSARAPEPSHS